MRAWCGAPMQRRPIGQDVLKNAVGSSAVWQAKETPPLLREQESRLVRRKRYALPLTPAGSSRL